MRIMGILNITPDSFFGPSRTTADDVLRRVGRMAEEGAAIVDLGAVSTRPGAPEVSEDEEWARLEPALRLLAPEEARCGLEISIDTFRSGIVRKACELLGRFWVNDISAGEDDPEMLATVGALGLPYIAMHKRGNPRTMDGLTDYEDGIIPELLGYFNTFSLKAEEAGITEWMADPGLGFAKTHSQNWEILERLGELSVIGRQLLIGAADKRFTGGDNRRAHLLAARGGAEVLRVHDVAATRISLQEEGFPIDARSCSCPEG